ACSGSCSCWVSVLIQIDQPPVRSLIGPHVGVTASERGPVGGGLAIRVGGAAGQGVLAHGGDPGQRARLVNLRFGPGEMGVRGFQIGLVPGDAGPVRVAGDEAREGDGGALTGQQCAVSEAGEAGHRPVTSIVCLRASVAYDSMRSKSAAWSSHRDTGEASHSAHLTYDLRSR